MKRLIIWVMAMLVLQIAIYGYLDQVLLAPSAGFTQHTIDGNTTAGNNGAEDKAEIYSHDRAYYAKLTEWNVVIYAAKDDSLVKEIDLKEDERVTYFSWLPERNLALLGLSKDGSRTTDVSLQSINPETNGTPFFPQIVGLAKGAMISDVAYSTETNVINILVKNGKYGNIYRTDANNNLREIATRTSHINRIACLQSDDTLLYDNLDSGEVYCVEGGSKAQIISPEDGKYYLVGVDKENNIYLGKVEDDNNISAIYKGQIDYPFEKFQDINSLHIIEDINITNEGSVIIK